MKETGIKLQHVTYSGSPAAQVDVIAGRVPLMVDMWSSAKQHVETGALKLIAVVTKDPLVGPRRTIPLMGTTFPVFDFTINNALIVRARHAEADRRQAQQGDCGHRQSARDPGAHARVRT